MYVHKTPPTPPLNTPFPCLNLKVGKTNYRLGKMDPNWAKCLKSGHNFSRSGPKNYSSSPGTRLDSTRTTLLALVPSTATDECTLQMQPSALPVYPSAARASGPGSRAAPAQAVEPAIEPSILSPSVPASQRHPAVPNGHSPAQTAPVCLRCLTSCTSARMS